MTDNIISFPLDNVPHRDGSPVSYDGKGNRMLLFAYEYKHAGKTWGASLWAYSWEDAEARVSSIAQTLTLEGQIVDITAGEI